jgi:hypothetical protein
MRQTVNHKDRKAKIEEVDYLDGYYNVVVDGQKIGEFVFSSGHDGLAGFSNSCGIDCYQHVVIGAETVWGCSVLYSSKREAVKGMIDIAIEKGILA